MSVDAETITINASATFLMLLPLIMLVRNDILKIIGYTVCLLYIITSAKRGNIIAAVIPTLIFIILMLRGNNRKMSIKTFFIVAIIVMISIFLYNQVLSNEFMMHRMEQLAEGKNSARSMIYANAWHAWYQSDSLIHYLLGFGFDATIYHPLMQGMHAHNDWLEILVDYGLIGIVFYLAIFVCFYLEIRNTKNTEYRWVLLSAMLIWLFKTVYSMGFTEPNLSLLFMSVGAVMGQREKTMEKNKMMSV